MDDYKQYLSELPKIQGAGGTDKKVNKSTEAMLCMEISNAFALGYFRYGYGGVMAYDGRKYGRIGKPEMNALILMCLEKNGVGDVYRANSVDRIRDTAVNKLYFRQYLPKKSLIAFNNKVLDLDAMDMHPHSERYETNIYIGYDYDPKARCDKWMGFLARVIEDPSAVDVLQEFCGAVFVDRKRFAIDQMLFLIGGGRNGKGVFLNTIKDTLGKDNITGYELDDLVRNPNYVYNINGKLANICMDNSRSDVSGGKFKQLVSGEPVAAKRLYEDGFMAEDIPLMMAAVNEVPATSDHSFGHERRHLFVPFNVRIKDEEVDTQLTYKLSSERAGIFNWLIEGRNRFIRREGKFTPSVSVEREKEKMRIESNNAAMFLADYGYYPVDNPACFENPKISTDFYVEYRNYCLLNGMKPFSNIRFGKLLAEMGFLAGHNRAGTRWDVYSLLDGKTDKDVKAYLMGIRVRDGDEDGSGDEARRVMSGKSVEEWEREKEAEGGRVTVETEKKTKAEQLWENMEAVDDVPF